MKKFFSPFKARRLNRKAAASRNMSKEIVKELSLLPGWNIADIGAGGGYYSFRFAGEVQRGGKVYAVDTNLDFLKYIARHAKRKKLNINTLAPPLKVSRESLDLIFCRNAFHHIASRVSYFRSLRPMLKSNGRAAIIDYKEGCGKKAGHYVRKEKIIKEMQQAGYRLEKEYDFLSEQSFTVYAPVKV